VSAEQVDVLIAGAGLAGGRVAETLRSAGHAGRILIAGDEHHPPYERPALSKELLAGTKTPDELALRDGGFWADQSVDLRLDTTVTDVDLDARTARVGTAAVAWRHLVIATGARARRLGFLPDLDGVHHLRSLAEALRLRAELRPEGRLAVIGAGFVGMEVASSARGLGLDVTVIEALDAPFAQALGPEVGLRVAERARDRGITLRLGALVKSLAGDGRVTGVQLTDGTVVPCDTVLVAVGAQPNSEILAGRIELAADGGVPTDACGRTAAPGVYACGDVASVLRPDADGHTRLEHWTAASGTGRSVGFAIIGEDRPDPAPPYFWSDHLGWRLQMVGHPGREDTVEIADADAGFTAVYRNEGGDMTAGLAVDRPEEIGRFRRALMGR